MQFLLTKQTVFIEPIFWLLQCKRVSLNDTKFGWIKLRHCINTAVVKELRVHATPLLCGEPEEWVYAMFDHAWRDGWAENLQTCCLHGRWLLFGRQPRVIVLSKKCRYSFWLHQIFPKTWCLKVVKLKFSHEKTEWDNNFLRFTCDTFIFKIVRKCFVPAKHYNPLDTLFFLENSLIILYLSVEVYPALLYPFRLTYH